MHGITYTFSNGVKFNTSVFLWRATLFHQKMPDPTILGCTSHVLMIGLHSLQSSSVSASQNATARNGTKKGRQPYEFENKSYEWVRKKLNALN